MVKLLYASVVFNSAEHTYYHNGVQLNGITGFIDKYINGGKFASLEGTAKKNAEKKAAYGSAVHDQLNMRINGMPYEKELPEVIACMNMLAEKGIKPMESEYLVSDFEFFASSIDMVDEDGNLYDFKTSSKLDVEAVRWQLSKYACLYEGQNPGLKAGKLFAIHLDGDNAELVEINRLPDSFIAAFDECCKSGADTFDNPRFIADKEEQGRIKAYKKLQEKLAKLNDSVARVEADIAEIESYFECRAITELETDYVRPDYKVHYTPMSFTNRQNFDIKSFLQNYGDNEEIMAIFNQYLSTTTSTRKAKVTINFNKE